ncbi:hypothetical protein HP436_00255 [Pseudomonas sp. CrR14]|nr:hypothetical protein [Pseudomonas sp. CrR14]
MGNQFKPGDLALITGHDHLPSNAGRTCELIAFLLPGDVIENPNNPSSQMEYDADGEPRWLVRGDRITNDSDDPLHAGLDAILECHLMPLRGEFEPEQQKQREAEPCA